MIGLVLGTLLKMPMITYNCPILFKRDVLADEFLKVHPQVRAAILEVARMSAAEGIRPPMVTSIYRKGDKKLHGHWAALDLRTENGHYTKEQKKKIEDAILGVIPNKFLRGDVILHDAGTGLHLHVEIEDWTWAGTHD